MHDVLMLVLNDDFKSAKDKVNEQMSNNDDNPCQGKKNVQYCQMHQVKKTLSNFLSGFNDDSVADRKASLLTWLAAHELDISDQATVNRLVKAVLGLIYEYVANNDIAKLTKLAELKPSEDIDLLLSKSSLSTTHEIKEVLAGTFRSVNDFLHVLKRGSSTTKVIISQYDFKEKLRMAKLDSISNQVEIGGLEIKRDFFKFTNELKDFIYDNNAARFGALGDFFQQLAKFDNKKNLLDVGFIKGRLDSFKLELEHEMEVVEKGLTSTIEGAVLGTVLELDEFIYVAAAEIAAAFNPFKFSKLTDILWAANQVAQAVVRTQKAFYLQKKLSAFTKLSVDLNKDFKTNAVNIKEIYDITTHLKDYFETNIESDNLTKLVDRFLTKYAAYGPAVSKTQLAKYGATLEAYFEAACDVLFEGEGIRSAVVEAVYADKGDCLKLKSNVAKVTSIQSELHDYQYDLLESLAVVMRSYVAAVHSKELNKKFEDGKTRKPYRLTENAKFQQQALGLILTSRLYFLQVIYQYCDYYEYINAGKRPLECNKALKTLSDNDINNLISLNEQTCENLRTATVLIPTRKSDKNKDYIPLKELYEGKEIEFQIPDIDWLIRYGWVLPFEAGNNAFYLKEFNLVLPDTHTSIRTVVVTISWSESASLFPSQSQNRYVIDPSSHRFEYRQNMICNDKGNFYNPYQICNDKKVRLCRISYPQHLHVYPSIFSKFKIKVRFYFQGKIVIPSFTTDFYLKADVSICQSENKKLRMKPSSVQRLHLHRPNCCRKVGCNATVYERYWNTNVKQPICSNCPKDSKSSETGYFCYE